MDFSTARFWVFYDGECGMCTGIVRRFGRAFARRGIGVAPLQDAAVKQRLGLADGAPLEEMKVLTRKGKVLGGVDGILHICRAIWWLWLIGVIGRLPGIHAGLARWYRHVAERRGCAGGRCGLGRSRGGV